MKKINRISSFVYINMSILIISIFLNFISIFNDSNSLKKNTIIVSLLITMLIIIFVILSILKISKIAPEKSPSFRIESDKENISTFINIVVEAYTILVVLLIVALVFMLFANLISVKIVLSIISVLFIPAIYVMVRVGGIEEKK